MLSILEVNFRRRYEVDVTGHSTIFAFSFLLTTQVLLASICTHFGVPSITYTLHSAVLLLMSADGIERSSPKAWGCSEVLHQQEPPCLPRQVTDREV